MAVRISLPPPLPSQRPVKSAAPRMPPSGTLKNTASTVRTACLYIEMQGTVQRTRENSSYDCDSAHVQDL